MSVWPRELEIAERDRETFVDISGEGTYQVPLRMQTIQATVNTANDSVTAYLPPVGEAKDMVYKFYCVLAANSKHFYVSAKGESSLAAGDGDGVIASIDMDTTGDYVHVRSNGVRWIVEASEMA